MCFNDYFNRFTVKTYFRNNLWSNDNIFSLQIIFLTIYFLPEKGKKKDFMSTTHIRHRVWLWIWGLTWTQMSISNKSHGMNCFFFENFNIRWHHHTEGNTKELVSFVCFKVYFCTTFLKTDLHKSTDNYIKHKSLLW